jgi:hypothetical protein
MTNDEDKIISAFLKKTDENVKLYTKEDSIYYYHKSIKIEPLLSELKEFTLPIIFDESEWPKSLFKEYKTWRSFSAENNVTTIEYRMFLGEKNKKPLYLFISRPLLNKVGDKALVYSQHYFSVFTLLKKNWLGHWTVIDTYKGNSDISY